MKNMMENIATLETLLNKTDTLIQEGEYDKAYLLLQEIIDLDPTFGKAYNHLGWLFETKFKAFDAAEEYYQKALDTTPDYISSYYNYAILLSTLRKFDDLNELLRKALVLC